jgi:hypothetical protein
MILCKLRKGKSSFFEGRLSQSKMLVKPLVKFVLNLRVVSGLTLAVRKPESVVRWPTASGFLRKTQSEFAL